MRQKFQINMGVRFKNKVFWIAFIPALLLLIRLILSLFGVEIDLSDIQGKLLSIVEALFALLAILGIVNDPTTEGVSDSDKAMLYEKPKER